jgi:hypothetical protein
MPRASKPGPIAPCPRPRRSRTGDAPLETNALLQESISVLWSPMSDVDSTFPLFFLYMHRMSLACNAPEKQRKRKNQSDIGHRTSETRERRFRGYRLRALRAVRLDGSASLMRTTLPPNCSNRMANSCPLRIFLSTSIVILCMASSGDHTSRDPLSALIYYRQKPKKVSHKRPMSARRLRGPLDIGDKESQALSPLTLIHPIS